MPGLLLSNRETDTCYLTGKPHSQVQELTDSGMTCYHWCGGYAVPPPTATGSIQRDMCLIDSCLGVGEVAVSDHRSSVPSVNLANIAR